MQTVTKNELLKKKRIVYFLLMLALTVLIGLFIAEILMRIFFPQQETMRWFASDKRYGFFLKKNFYQKYHYINSDFVMEVKTNSWGLRGNEYSLSDLSNPSIKKVLLLGDSFVFGQGVNIEDTFGAKLEGLLNKSGKKYMVINAGISGWGTLQEVMYAKDHFDEFQPDIIILTFCQNDPTEDGSFLKKRSNFEKRLFYFPGKIFLRDHSHLYRFLVYVFYKALNCGFCKKKIQNGITFITPEEWNRTLGYIKEFYNSYLKFNSKGILLLQTWYPCSADEKSHLSSISNGNNLIYLDFCNDAILLNDKEKILPYDAHWNPLMHSLSAKKIFETIKRLLGPF